MGKDDQDQAVKIENGGKEAGSTTCYLRIDAAFLIFCIYIHRDVSKNFIIRTAPKEARLYLHFSASSLNFMAKNQ